MIEIYVDASKQTNPEWSGYGAVAVGYCVVGHNVVLCEGSVFVGRPKVGHEKIAIAVGLGMSDNYSWAQPVVVYNDDVGSVLKMQGHADGLSRRERCKHAIVVKHISRRDWRLRRAHKYAKGEMIQRGYAAKRHKRVFPKRMGVAV